MERTQDMRDEEYRLTQLAVIGLGNRVLEVAAGFRIEENRAHNLLQLRWGIAMGREHTGNALDVAGTRVTGDQILDELFAHERSDILVLDKVIDGGVELFLLRLSLGQYEPVQQRFGSPIMVILPA